jgi:predicted naringenin-chalcone synthase
MRIAGIGTAVPIHTISQADAAEIAKHYSCDTAAQERLFATLYRRAGVESRHSVVLNASGGDLAGRQTFYADEHPTTVVRMRQYEAHAGDLAAEAAAVALNDAGVASSRITHLVTVSCSGFYAPGFDVELMRRLPLSAGVGRTHIGFMGCQGALNGLRVARAFVDADPSACVLLCAVELCSLHHQFGWDADTIVANALFADGAAAVVGLADDSSRKESARETDYRLVASGSTLIEDSADAMSWRIGDHGFRMTLSSRVPDLICEHLRPWLEGWLAPLGLTLDAVGSWAVHPGGPRILSAFREATGLDASTLQTSGSVLAEYGNMSSPTVLFILDRLRRAEASRPCVALAFGPGLAVEAALLR